MPCSISVVLMESGRPGPGTLSNDQLPVCSVPAVAAGTRGGTYDRDVPTCRRVMPRKLLKTTSSVLPLHYDT